MMNAMKAALTWASDHRAVIGLVVGLAIGAWLG